MKMTEDEAIAYLRTFNAWRCGDESQEAPTPSTVTEAIRTVCDTLEAQRRAVPVMQWRMVGSLGWQDCDQKEYDETLADPRFECRVLYAAAPAQPATETAGDARDAELIVHRIARALAVEDGYDPDDKACGLYDLRWSGGTEPEPVGDAFTMDYLPRAERIAAIISAKTGV